MCCKTECAFSSLPLHSQLLLTWEAVWELNANISLHKIEAPEQLISDKLCSTALKFINRSEPLKTAQVLHEIEFIAHHINWTERNASMLVTSAAKRNNIIRQMAINYMMKIVQLKKLEAITSPNEWVRNLALG